MITKLTVTQITLYFLMLHGTHASAKVTTAWTAGILYINSQTLQSEHTAEMLAYTEFAFHSIRKKICPKHTKAVIENVT